MSSNIEVKLDVLNQKASPALYAAPLASRPAASFTGRLFVDSDSPSTGIYRDTGTTWVQVADQGAGTTGTLQQVTTNGSSTTVGISTSGNGIGIGTTIPASNRLDIHSATGVQATFNGTGVTNAALQFQLAGVSKWNIGNLYNAAANDFIITDNVNALNRITVKNTGQTFIGTDTTSSGLLVVNTATPDNHIVVIGANSPSIRLRNTGTSPTLGAGLGIATAVNNFIQGTAAGEFCLFNANTTASPILFGVWNGTFVQEAARITASRNFLINTTTDTGSYKLDVSGIGRFGVSTASSTVTIGQTVSNSGYIINADGYAASQYGYRFNNINGGSAQFCGNNLFVVHQLNGGAQGNTALQINGATGSSIPTSTILELISTTQGFLPPRMTTTQKNAIATPATGLVIFDTTLGKLCVFSTTWQTVTSV
jgi:hypothetical protein